MTALTINILDGHKPIRMLFNLTEERLLHRHMANRLRSGEYYEPDVSKFLLRVLREGDVVVDVGANVGFFTTMVALLVGPTGRVLAFEPGTNNLDELRTNIALNQIGNVDIIEAPLSNRSERRRFFINSDDGGGNALWDPAEFPGNVKSQAEQRFYDVETSTLDHELARLTPLKAPKVVKIDTEGAEQLILEGARETLTGGQVEFFVCELHNFGLAKLGCDQRSFRALMRSHGYETFLLSTKGALPYFVPAASDIVSKFIVNLVFARPESVALYWPQVQIDPRTI